MCFPNIKKTPPIQSKRNFDNTKFILTQNQINVNILIKLYINIIGYTKIIAAPCRYLTGRCELYIKIANQMRILSLLRFFAFFPV